MLKSNARRVRFDHMRIWQRPDTRNDRNHWPRVDRMALTWPHDEDWLASQLPGICDEVQGEQEARRMGAVPRWG